MKKIKQFGFALFAIMLLVSCDGGIIKEKTIKATGISISGDGSTYFKVVDGNYTFKKVSDEIVVGITFELIQEYDGAKDPEMGDISLIPIDKSGVALPDIGLDFTPATMSDWDKVTDLLKGKVGDRITISFKWSYFSDKKVQKRIMNDVDGFEITRTDITNSETNEVATIDDTNNESISNINKEDWDQVLISYEKYIDHTSVPLKVTETE